MFFFSRRFVVLFLASLIYFAVNAYAISHGVSHFELIGIALQFALLLPAVLFALRGSGEASGNGFGFDPGARATGMAIGGFVLVCLCFSLYIGQGIVFADETSYKFQAEVFDLLKLTGLAPPGATEVAAQVPWPLAFKHLIVSKAGWFSKYPIGWPLVLAVAEKVHMGWAVNPILGGVLLVITGMIARESFGSGTVFPAVAMAILSPYLLSNATGRMSHGLCAVLIALATLFYLRGIRTNRIGQFAWMYVALIGSYQVRPFTAFVVTGVLALGLLLHYRRDGAMLIRVLMLSGVAGVFAVGSVLEYNQLFTGHALLSPYALYDGTATPTDLHPTAMKILQNIVEIRRYSIQTTLLYTFPFAFVLAGYAYWMDRRSPTTRVLAALFPAILVAHFFQVFGTAPIVGERYYFEGYFAVVVLAAVGLQRLLGEWHVRKAAVIGVAAALAVVQVGMTVVGAKEIAKVGRPYREVERVAETERGCHCAVFLQSTPDHFYYSPNLNLNTPEWRSAAVFFMNDPGPGSRRYWAGLFGWKDWVVITYDEARREARVERSEGGR